MTKLSYTQARNELGEACQHYLIHNKAQLDNLMGESPSYPPYLFFNYALRKNQPASGFHDFIACKHFAILKLLLYRNEKHSKLNIKDYLDETYWIATNRGHVEYEELKFLRGFEERIGTEVAAVDQSDPKIVLHNLQALLSLFNQIMSSRMPNFGELKKQENFSEESYLFKDNTPLSVKIYKTFAHLHSLARFVVPLLKNNDTNLPYISGQLYHMSLSFEGYLKHVVVRELQSTLQSGLGDEEAVKRVEAQLREGVMLEILGKNRQSPSEQHLKLLSVIAILVGIGIFTTLVLACKRYYDSEGASINFFKPLSENLYEKMAQITTDTFRHTTAACQTF